MGWAKLQRQTWQFDAILHLNQSSRKSITCMATCMKRSQEAKSLLLKLPSMQAASRSASSAVAPYCTGSTGSWGFGSRQQSVGGDFGRFEKMPQPWRAAGGWDRTGARTHAHQRMPARRERVDLWLFVQANRAVALLCDRGGRFHEHAMACRHVGAA